MCRSHLALDKGHSCSVRDRAHRDPVFVCQTSACIALGLGTPLPAHDHDLHRHRAEGGFDAEHFAGELGSRDGTRAVSDGRRFGHEKFAEGLRQARMHK